MWIYVPDTVDKKEPWVGTVTLDEGPESRWRFELIRHVDFCDTHRKNPFDNSATVIGLLDHQEECTIIRPLVNRIDPGSFGVRIHNSRAIISGTFVALLRNISITDANERIFSEIWFESNAFSAWYSESMYNYDYNYDTKTPTLDIKDTVTSVLNIDNLGCLTFTSGTRISSHARSGSIRSITELSIELKQEASLNEVIDTCLGLELLFGFLIGFRGKPPMFRVLTNKTYKSGEREFSVDGTLQFGGIDWKEGDPPYPSQCIHLNGLGETSIKTIIKNYILNIDDFVARIHAVEFSMFFSNTINDRFSVIIPILEDYLKRTYYTDDEVGYRLQEINFFEWVKSSESEEIREFSRKHICVKGKKSPSLKTLIERAIRRVNDRGFGFNLDLARRIQERRGRVFHSAPQMSDSDIRLFYEEIRAATALLTLHTFLDLGIDIACLVERAHVFPDMLMWGFMRKPSSPETTAEQPVGG